MPRSLFDKLSAWLPAMEQKNAGVSVVYARGADSLALTAAVGNTEFASNMQGGTALIHGERDYLISVADLAFGEPQIGDKVTEVIGGAAAVFEVMDTDTGEPAWRYSGPDRATWRIHVKRK